MMNFTEEEMARLKEVCKSLLSNAEFNGDYYFVSDTLITEEIDLLRKIAEED